MARGEDSVQSRRIQCQRALSEAITYVFLSHPTENEFLAFTTTYTITIPRFPFTSCILHSRLLCLIFSSVFHSQASFFSTIDVSIELTFSQWRVTRVNLQIPIVLQMLHFNLLNRSSLKQRLIIYLCNNIIKKIIF